jgi:hypothetical protein
MMFTPDKCCRIIIATAILHNICISRRIPLLEELEPEAEDDGVVYDGLDVDGIRGRARVVEQYFRN